MAQLAPYLILLWIPIGLLLFTHCSRQTAVLAIALLGTLFLPEIQWSPVEANAPRAIWELTKTNIISYALILGWLIFDRLRFSHVRIGIVDLPVFLLVVCPLVSCMIHRFDSNYAIALLRADILLWAVPYIIGRVYLGDAIGCRLTTAALALGGLMYVPFCLFEVRMSPQLHNIVYGFTQHAFAQTVRQGILGTYRPMVFMQHGLAVGIFLSAATICLTWLYRARVWPLPELPAIFRRQPVLWVLILGVTTVLCKSVGALILCVMALAALFVGERLRLRLLMGLLLIVPPVYVTARATGWLKSETILRLIGQQVNAERTDSIEFRLVNEDKFIATMGDNQLYGMGGSIKHPRDHNNAPLIADGCWIIVYFSGGAIALAALIAMFALPVVRFLFLCPTDSWAEPLVAPAAAAAAVLAILMIDCLLNFMLNPVFLMLVGALNGWCDGLVEKSQQPSAPI